jgi:predicted transcriptional regulator
MVGVPKFDSPEEEIKRWVNHIALICLSDDFQKLKKELETIYSRSSVEDFRTAAFQDALYAFLAQEEEGLAVKSGRC